MPSECYDYNSQIAPSRSRVMLRSGSFFSIATAVVPAVHIIIAKHPEMIEPFQL